MIKQVVSEDASFAEVVAKQVDAKLGLVATQNANDAKCTK